MTASSSRLHAVGLAVAVAALAGCSATNPITTTRPYAPSDGVAAQVGDVRAANLLVVAAAADGPGALQGALTNAGTSDQRVTVGSAGAPVAEVDVAAGSTVLLGGAGERIVFTVPDAPGATTPLTLSSTGSATTTVPVPVLDGTLSEYATLVPSPSATR